MNFRLSTRDTVFIVLLLFLIGFPAVQYSAIGITGIYDAKRFWQIPLFFLLGFMTIFVHQTKNDAIEIVTKIPGSILYSLLGVLGVGFLTSILIAEYPDWAFLEVGHYLIMMLLIFLVGGISLSNINKSLFYLCVAVIGLTGVYLFRVSISYYLFQIGSYPLWPGSEYSIGLYGFADKRVFNHIQTWTIPILVSVGWYFWRFSKRQVVRWCIAALIVGWGMLVISSGARGTTLGVVVGFLLLLFTIVRERWQFFRYNAGLAVSTLLSYYIFFEWLGGKGPAPTVLRSGSSGRLEMWVEVIREIVQQPFLGYGPMHYASITSGHNMASPHSWLLQTTYEWGLPVAVILIGIILFGLYHYYKQLKANFYCEEYNVRKKWIKFGILWSLLAAFTHSFFSSVMNTQLSQVWFILIVGVSIGTYYQETAGSGSGKSLIAKWTLVSLVLLSFGLYVNWGLDHSLDREKQNQIYLKTKDTNLLYPRFWQQGKIGLDDIKTEKAEVQN